METVKHLQEIQKSARKRRKVPKKKLQKNTQKLNNKQDNMDEPLGGAKQICPSCSITLGHSGAGRDVGAKQQVEFVFPVLKLILVLSENARNPQNL